MNKEAAPEDLVKAIRKILDGGVYVSTALAERLASDLSSGGGRPLHELLSVREFEVLRMLASGKGIKQIAEELHLGVTTISTYRARILEKMRMSSTSELMRYAIDKRLID
jgi:two-component system invasion response regulator UvrY